MTQETVTIKLSGLTRPYTFYHTSDCHVAYAAADASQEAKATAEKYAKFWCPSGPSPAQAFENALRIADENHADGIFLCGDVADYYSGDTARYIKSRLQSTATEAFYVYGNHEGSVYNQKTADARARYPEYAEVMQGSPACWARDFGEFLIVGMDNGDKKIQAEQLAFLEAQFAKDKPILLLIHIPLYTEAIVGPVKAKWGENGCDYFTLGQPQDTELSRKFCQAVKRPDNHIAAIFAGHIHLAHEGEFSPGRMQYTSAPTFQGSIRKVCLIKADD